MTDLRFVFVPELIQKYGCGAGKTKRFGRELSRAVVGREQYLNWEFPSGLEPADISLGSPFISSHGPS